MTCPNCDHNRDYWLKISEANRKRAEKAETRSAELYAAGREVHQAFLEGTTNSARLFDAMRALENVLFGERTTESNSGPVNAGLQETK